MRPQDILGMVEEAAGTRMFEERKEKSLKIIARKNMKVEELQADIDEEITPKLAKLREEKRSYVQWQRTCTELERIGRTLRAYEYTDAHQRAVAKQNEIEGVEREVTALKNDKGKPVIRPYTPISPSNAPGELTFLVKQYPQGLASVHIHNLKPGDTLSIKGPILKFPYKSKQSTFSCAPPIYRALFVSVNEFDEVALIGGGSGM